MPWDNPDMYAKWSPSFFAKTSKRRRWCCTARSIIGSRWGRGCSCSPRCRLQKVPSKIVLFPDEGHWITKPQNSVLWYAQFLEWVGEWLKKPAN